MKHQQQQLATTATFIKNKQINNNNKQQNQQPKDPKQPLEKQGKQNTNHYLYLFRYTILSS